MKFTELIEHIEHNAFLLEAFKASDFDKALNLMVSVLNKKIGPLKRLPGFDRFENSKGKGQGVRFFTPNKRCFRLNFAKDDTKSELVSIDIFDPSKGMNPIVNVNTKGVSVVKVIPVIAELIKSPKPGNYQVNLTSDDGLVEKKYNMRKPIEEAKTVTLDGKEYPTKGAAWKELRSRGYKTKEIVKLMENDVIVTKGLPEKTIMNTKQSEKILKQVTINPNDILDKHIPSFTRGIAKGLKHTLIIAGTPGVGKTASLSTKFDIKYV